MKNVLKWYFLLLIVLFCSAIFMREGFESSPATLFKDLANKKAFILVYRSDCVHCKNLKPAWEKVAAKHPEQMVAVDATDSSNPEIQTLTSKLNVTGYPAMFEMNNGEVVKSYDGGRSEQDLTNFVESM